MKVLQNVIPHTMGNNHNTSTIMKLIKLKQESCSETSSRKPLSCKLHRELDLPI